MRAIPEYKEDTAVVTKNACVVVKRVPAPKTGGLLAKIKALDAAAALQSTATYGILLRSVVSDNALCFDSLLCFDTSCEICHLGSPVGLRPCHLVDR